MSGSRGVVLWMCTYRPAMDDDKCLRLRIELALLYGVGPPGHNVAHVIIWGVGRAQGELGHDVCVIREPLGGGDRRGGGGDAAVHCCNTCTHTNMRGHRGTKDLHSVWLIRSNPIVVFFSHAYIFSSFFSPFWKRRQKTSIATKYVSLDHLHFYIFLYREIHKTKTMSPPFAFEARLLHRAVLNWRTIKLRNWRCFFFLTKCGKKSTRFGSFS